MKLECSELSKAEPETVMTIFPVPNHQRELVKEHSMNYAPKTTFFSTKKEPNSNEIDGTMT